MKDGLFSVSPYVCLSLSLSLSLWIRSCSDRNCSRRATVRLGIATLIANILVLFMFQQYQRIETYEKQDNMEIAYRINSFKPLYLCVEPPTPLAAAAAAAS